MHPLDDSWYELEIVSTGLTPEALAVVEKCGRRHRYQADARRAAERIRELPGVVKVAVCRYAKSAVFVYTPHRRLDAAEDRSWWSGDR